MEEGGGERLERALPTVVEKLPGPRLSTCWGEGRGRGHLQNNLRGGYSGFQRISGFEGVGIMETALPGPREGEKSQE